MSHRLVAGLGPAGEIDCVREPVLPGEYLAGTVTFQCPRMAMIENFVKSFMSRVRLIAMSMLWFLPSVWVRPMPKKITPNLPSFNSATIS